MSEEKMPDLSGIVPDDDTESILNFEDDEFEFGTDLSSATGTSLDDSEVIKTRHSSFEVLMDYVRNTPDGGEFSFSHTGDIASAKSFIQSMRTQLSRFRAKVIERGGKPKKFYTSVSSIKCGENHVCEITLKRTIKKEKEVNKMMENFLDDLSI